MSTDTLKSGKVTGTEIPLHWDHIDIHCIEEGSLYYTETYMLLTLIQRVAQFLWNHLVPVPMTSFFKYSTRILSFYTSLNTKE